MGRVPCTHIVYACALMLATGCHVKRVPRGFGVKRGTQIVHTDHEALKYPYRDCFKAEADTTTRAPEPLAFAVLDSFLSLRKDAAAQNALRESCDEHTCGGGTGCEGFEAAPESAAWPPSAI